MQNLDKSYETIDQHTLDLVKETGTHNVYYCPFCVDKLNKADTEGKLYYSIDKDVGWCFRCHTVVYPEADETISEEESALGKSIRGAVKRFASSEDLDFTMPTPVGFDFSALTLEARKYWQRRHIYPYS